MRANKPVRWSILLTTALAMTLFFAPAPAQEGECRAEVSARLTQEEPYGETTRLQFDVEVTTQETCADVVFDLIVHENARGAYNRKRLIHELKVRDGSKTMQVQTELPSGHRYMDQEVQLVRCKPC